MHRSRNAKQNQHTLLIKKGDKVKQFTDLRVLVDKMKEGDLDTEGLVPIDMKSSSTPVAL
jgi:hypothetical protein